MEELFAWLAVAAAGVWTGLRAIRNRVERRRARRLLRALPALGPGTPEGATVKVTGVVRAIEPLTAPLSGRACVVFRARAEIPTSRGSSYPAPIRERIESLELTPFTLDRGDEGTVLVDGSHAILDLPALAARDTVPALCEKFLIGRGLTLRDASSARFDETIVEPGTTITVTGLVLHDVASDPSAIERDFREAPPPALRLTGNAAHPLAIGASLDEKPA